MGEFAIGLYSKLLEGVTTYYYGNTKEIKIIFESLWKEAKEWHTIVTIFKYKNKNDMIKEIEYKKKVWIEEENNTNVEFIYIGNQGSEEIA